MYLKDRDIVMLAYLSITNGWSQPYYELAKATDVSVSEAYSSVKRLQKCRFLFFDEHREYWEVHHKNVLQFCLCAIPHLYPVEKISIGRGVLTGGDVYPLNETLIESSEPMVWLYPEGKSRGVGLKPIHPSIPSLALKYPKLHSIFAALDTLREGKARERKVAQDALSMLLGGKDEAIKAQLVSG